MKIKLLINILYVIFSMLFFVLGAKQFIDIVYALAIWFGVTFIKLLVDLYDERNKDVK